MKIAIVGWGVEGQSAYRFFGPGHDYLIVNEHQPANFPPQSPRVKLQFLGGRRPAGMVGTVADLSYLDGVEACELIVYSPAAAKNLEKKFGHAEDFWAKTTTVQHLFFEHVKSRHIIGVTGTKGKGTTSTLIAQMLEAAGYRVHLGGNIGRSLLDFVSEVQPDDWVVLELSSFQLYRLNHSPHIGVCLMIAAEHLDWHSDLAEYMDAKANLFKYQTSSDVAIYFSHNELSAQIASHGAGRKLPYFKPPGARVNGEGMIVVGEPPAKIIKTDELKLLGAHNHQNVCAALTAVWQVSQNAPALRSVLSAFGGLEHRLELVRELDGVSYYDDSFGTTPETAIVAIEAFERPKILIAGGSDKGIPFDGLADAVVAGNVKHVIAIGDTGPVIEKLLRTRGYTAITGGLAAMPDIVAAARRQAGPGDVVLLSTGCASFGLFKDYKDRGNQFKAAVNNL